MTYAVLLCLHLIAAAFWVGGMAALHFAVRPAAIDRLEPPQRLAFFDAALGRFFAGVTAAIVVILVSGPAMIVLAGGLARMHLGDVLHAPAAALHDLLAAAEAVGDD